jgi:hypothetical protein
MARIPLWYRASHSGTATLVTHQVDLKQKLIANEAGTRHECGSDVSPGAAGEAKEWRTGAHFERSIFVDLTRLRAKFRSFNDFFESAAGVV